MAGLLVASAVTYSGAAPTGAVEWNRTDLGEVEGSLAAANDTVYVAADGVTSTDEVRAESGTPGLYVVDADTGETAATYDLDLTKRSADDAA